MKMANSREQTLEARKQVEKDTKYRFGQGKPSNRFQIPIATIHFMQQGCHKPILFELTLLSHKGLGSTITSDFLVTSKRVTHVTLATMVVCEYRVLGIGRAFTWESGLTTEPKQPPLLHNVGIACIMSIEGILKKRR